MSPQETILALTEFVRDTVRPHLGLWHSRAISGTANSGDATFAIDDVAESAIISFIEQHKLNIALYSEDKGLIEFGLDPPAVLIIDPIDGTRPAIAGFESCVVSVAWANYSSRTIMADVTHACIAEIKGNSVFQATRGCGVKWTIDGVQQALRILNVSDITLAPLTFETVARPFEIVATVLSEIVDMSSMKGGVFLFNSTAFSLTRLLTGQLAAVLDVGNRVMRDHPELRAKYVHLGFGTPIGLFTYDIAAAVLIAQEAGVYVTDAFGNSFDNVALLDTGEHNIMSIVAASTEELHKNLIASINYGSSKIGKQNELD